jgi:hypothetical protein
MTQKTDPFISLSWGWSSGEDGWGTGLNNNLITYAFFLNTRFDGTISTTASLPASPSEGQAYFVTTENTFYFRAEGAWYSTVPPVGKTFILKGTEAVYKFTGGSLVLDTKSISDVAGLQTALDSKLDDSQRGTANGVAPLGADNKVPSSYLPENGSYKGVWNAATNTPTIVSGVGSNGDFYRVSVGGTTTINGESSWSIGDEIRFNGTVWQRIPNTGGVSSVNGETGSVILDANDVGATPSSHIGSGGSQHADATTTTSGFFTPSEKIKLSGISSGATANQTDSYLLSRANHTGTQAQSTITNLTTDLASKQATLVSGTNIKTINGASILGSGDIVISGGGEGTTFTALTDTPASYTGNAEKAIVVKLDESGLEFVSIGSAAFNNTGDFATASHTHANATTSLAGFQSAADKVKLNGIATGATANQTDTYLLSRANHTGTQSYTTITGLATVASSGSATDLITGIMNDARLPSTMSAKAFTGNISTPEVLFGLSSSAGAGNILNGGIRCFAAGNYNYGIAVNSAAGGLEYHADQAGGGSHRWYTGDWNNPVGRMVLDANGNLTVNGGVIYGNGSGLTGVNASTLQGLSSATSNTPNTLVARDASSYIYADYINTDIPQTSGNISDIYVGQDSNNFIYKASPAYVLAAMGGVASSSLAAIATSGSATDLIAGTVNNARLNTASTSGAGIVQLSNSVSGVSTTLAATENAVTTAYNQATAATNTANTAISRLNSQYEAPEQQLNNLGTGSGTRTISAVNGTHVLATANGNCAWVFPSPSTDGARAITLELTNGGAFTMTWPAGTRWAGGVAPTLTASGTDILVFTKAGTANWRGYLSSKDNK